MQGIFPDLRGRAGRCCDSRHMDVATAIMKDKGLCMHNVGMKQRLSTSVSTQPPEMLTTGVRGRVKTDNYFAHVERGPTCCDWGVVSVAADRFGV